MNHWAAELGASGMTLVGMGRQLRPRSQLDSVRAGIGSALHSLYSDVLREPLPDRIVELLSQLDERLRRLDRDSDEASCR
jgi:hypothetical protein